MRKLMVVITETVAMIAVLFGIYCWNKEMLMEIVVLCVLILFVLFCIKHTEKGEWFFQYVRGLYYKTKLAKCGKRFRVEQNVRFIHPEKIEFGDNCDVAQSAVFAPLVSTRGGYPSRIIIGDRVHIGAFDRIASMNEVRIDDDVLFAAFVHITDHSHDYHDIDSPIKKQGVITKGPVHICRGAWLAFGCHILSGVTIGENSVVAANAVVTKDVPPYSIVAGNPARIVKQYDHDTGKWKSIPKI